jgi:hypothetical protein
MADHADDVVAEHAEVESAVAAAGEPAVTPEQLAEERQEVEPAPGEHPEVAVHRQDVIVLGEGGDHACRDRFLSDPREPLRELALPQQDEHLLFDEARQQDRAIHRPQLIRGQLVDRRREIVLGDGGVLTRTGHGLMILSAV